ncbi:acyl-CoA dehydrogenase [Mycobacterium sp. CBMA293]|uniref:acyl-CoA dehydrogenase family protein n=1 Tax=unclassified Mycolicibacterium TaxID=2636767 RepID=UPI0012DE9C2B|nr:MULTISPECIES: acyl-CoA dehydrogenase family protein [unclassified Mycolicibacterium]MUL46945.1 acyl-CoA dehydrogenase [Mycolicibacterium sp. CBMA 360]MUL57268.1 acyl-CoA dehydrogenase [Mycolicibacterium sp. CBMA 335]MUL70308.1 acyl-CoA dehydrogenase [Mycolicibacterium sp. CBMA 311]MUL92356.1 acyl-CoA dehydrogenase [Mycolicibacterium sp. CBMA 230]MUM06777.1 acyl-CoA dehydrogenase [Mycolicibacterium sp. CBMA 213]
MTSALVPPYRPLPPETHELRAEVREFLNQDRASYGWSPRVDSWIASWDPEFSRRLGRRGWLGMTFPSEYGGGGRSHIERFVVIEELLAAGAPIAAHWVADRQAGPSLLKHGNETQRQRYLPAIAAGECYFAIGMSEPESGSDLASVRTKGVRVDGGWELTGTKVWTSGAHHSHAFVVLARTSELDTAKRHEGLSQFVVPLDSPGIEIRPIKLLTGAHHFNEVVLTKTFVPDDMVLGNIGDGWEQVTSELGFERSGPERILSAQPLLDALVRTTDDEAWLATDVGDLVSQLATLRQLSGSVAGALSRGESVGVAAATVKDLGTRFEGAVIDVAAQSSSTLPEVDGSNELDRLLAEGILHAPGFTLRGGTNEILSGVIARGLGLR